MGPKPRSILKRCPHLAKAKRHPRRYRSARAWVRAWRSGLADGCCLLLLAVKMIAVGGLDAVEDFGSVRSLNGPP